MSDEPSDLHDLSATLSITDVVQKLGPIEAGTLLATVAEALAKPGSSSPLRPRPPAERYERLDLLGRGGMGEVWRVWDNDLNRSVAMKVLEARHSVVPGQVARFVEEAQVTAQLQHPAIVPVHEVGQLEDGRIFFTMREVAGWTMRELIGARFGRRYADKVERWSLRRLVDALRRIAEALGYAHARGVAHRDLKPSNVMAGPFGEVYVMDWGLARVLSGPDTITIEDPIQTDRVDITRMGAAMGTPQYLSPEQARGDRDAIGPAADVFALGAILFEMLTGQVPIPGSSGRECIERAIRGERRPMVGALPIPDELATLCDAAMQPDPIYRPADAGAMAELLLAWLDGVQRDERATALVDEAAGLEPTIASLWRRSRAAAGEAMDLLGPLPSFATDEARRPGWAKEDEAAELRREAVDVEGRWIQALRSALQLAPDHAAAHRRLAKHFRERHEEAEASGDEDAAARYELRLREHDRGEHANYLNGTCLLSLETRPEGAEVTWVELAERDRRLQPGRRRILGRTPLHDVEIPRGSCVLEIHGDGRAPVTYPVLAERGGVWDGARPGSFGPYPIWLPSDDELADDEVYVPAGWAWTGGDPEAGEPLPRRRVWIDGFVMKRFPVTHGEYLEFVNQLAAEGRGDEAEGLVPRRPLSGEAGEPLYTRSADGRWVLGVDEESRSIHPNQPARLVNWEAARRLAAHRAETSGVPWRLPNELEWEKAARGVDGRPFVWGRHREASWANSLGAVDGVPGPSLVHEWPLDESVYGVRGLAGNVRDYCANPWTHGGPPISRGRLVLQGAKPDAELIALRGGAWQSTEMLSRAATRFANAPTRRVSAVGFRLVRSVSG